jgi:quercetin dioxygenase-like cupin family protein
MKCYSSTEMKKSNIHSPGDKREINLNWFTGKVHMKDISSKIKSKEQDIYHVYFENGARTKIHLHNGNQILIVTKGIGSLEMFRKYGTKNEDFKIKMTENVSLKEGDIVHIPSNTLHTHGSSNKMTFSHIAINILPSKNSEYKTTWYESDFKTKVTERI